MEIPQKIRCKIATSAQTYVNKDMEYRPIDCNFYDYVEHFATLRKKITIKYSLPDSSLKSVSTIITDTQQKEDGEYILIKGEPGEIRMDYLVSLDEIEASSFSQCQLPSS